MASCCTTRSGDQRCAAAARELRGRLRESAGIVGRGAVGGRPRGHLPAVGPSRNRLPEPAHSGPPPAAGRVDW